ncbi:MAG: hypothetical protein HQK81_07980 [Desulfovibrionaceae bacterium]|nr:hypothetical protein [Desulfovibrionaceae bacterium]MBF0513989.1 hypothetical protein [Desulfovibrionaceae bacterium]
MGTENPRLESSAAATNPFSGSAGAGAAVTTAAVLNESAPTALPAIGVAQQAYDVAGGASVNLGSIFSIASSQVSGFYVEMYDRDNYAGAQTYDYGTLTDAKGRQYSGSDYLLWFSLNPKTGQYANSAGETLSNFTFTASTQTDRAQDINLVAYNSKYQTLDDRTVDIVTNVATPAFAAGASVASDIAAEAASFIGQPWDPEGCYNLAQDVTAACGVSLDLKSGWIESDVNNNGALQVVYNAANGIVSNWESDLQPGDIVEMGWNYGGGHIAVVDKVADGVAYVADNSGDPVKDGSAADVKIAEEALPSYNPDIVQNTVIVYRVAGASLNVPGAALSASATGIASTVGAADLTGSRPYPGGMLLALS